VAEPTDKHEKMLHISEHLANERTILAWIRTAIAVMTLGVAINRFSLFLIEFSQTVPGFRPGHHLHNVRAEELGIGLVVLGVVMMVGASWHYLHVANAIDDGTYRPARLKIVLTSILVLGVGGASLLWLIL
jgi:putative membrane protein